MTCESAGKDPLVFLLQGGDSFPGYNLVILKMDYQIITHTFKEKDLIEPYLMCLPISINIRNSSPARVDGRLVELQILRYRKIGSRL